MKIVEVYIMAKLSSKDVDWIVEVADDVYNGKRVKEEASEMLSKALDNSTASNNMYFIIYSCMMEGKPFKRAAKDEIVVKSIEYIFSNYGTEQGEKAMQAAASHVLYFEGLGLASKVGLRKSLDEVAESHGIEKPNYDQLKEKWGNILQTKSKRAWIFQGNPQSYNVMSAVKNSEIITWSTKQSYRQIHKGDTAYIWVSGIDGGIVAVGTILEEPADKKQNSDDPYLLKPDLHNETYLGVDIKIEQYFESPVVTREQLAKDVRTAKMTIVRRPNGTNFSVNGIQNQVIEDIIAEEYEAEELPTYEALPLENADKRYWTYAPGEGASEWENFYNEGIMAIGWEDVGDLSEYASREAIREKLRELSGEDKSYRNDSLGLWQFANDISVGDIIYAKQGMHKIIGRGIVESEYIFDETRQSYKSIRNVRWTHNVEWNYHSQLAQKTLTDITPYLDFWKELENYFLNEGDVSVLEEEPEKKYAEYSTDSFLQEVYTTREKFDTLQNLLNRKKNLILQGAPGVGKTFSAIRLAFALMGEKDTSRVQMIQFHQNYSYEDFIMGYRPNKSGGFDVKHGPFYKFCKKAAEDGRPHFFIIDEINRGNISKIFGELMMLIEGDKRGKEIQLLYGDELFFVPKNVYIIGMMNTADRSLALIDYALRRRFAFFEMEPAFDTEGFKAYQNKVESPYFDRLLLRIKELNSEIAKDPSLGSGFQIGHSFLCGDKLDDRHNLADVINYELVPLLEEYWFDETEKVEKWKNNLLGAL